MLLESTPPSKEIISTGDGWKSGKRFTSSHIFQVQQCNFTLKNVYLLCEEAPTVVASIKIIFG